MKLKMLSRPQAGIVGPAASLFALLLLQVILFGGSRALHSQSNRPSVHRNGAADALPSLGAAVFVVLAAGGLLASPQPETARRSK